MNNNLLQTGALVGRFCCWPSCGVAGSHRSGSGLVWVTLLAPPKLAALVGRPADAADVGRCRRLGPFIGTTCELPSFCMYGDGCSCTVLYRQHNVIHILTMCHSIHGLIFAAQNIFYPSMDSITTQECSTFTNTQYRNVQAFILQRFHCTKCNVLAGNL